MHPTSDEIIDKIAALRRTNNSYWMEILKLALQHAPQETRKVLSQLNEGDIAVTEQAKLLAQTPDFMLTTFRNLTPEDSIQLLSWRNSPDVARHMYTSREITQAEHDKWFASLPGNRSKRYWIIQHDSTPVGLVNLYDIDHENRRCAWAFYIGVPGLRGKGIGSATERFILRHVFRELNFNKLWCEVLVTNPDVIRLHEKFGFKQEAMFRSHILRLDGEAVAAVGMGLLAAEYDSHK